MRTVGYRIPAGVSSVVMGLMLILLACHLGACGEVKTGRSSSKRGGDGNTSHPTPEIHLQNPLQLTNTGTNRQALFGAVDQQIVWLQAESDLRQFRLFTMSHDGQNARPLTRDGVHCQGFDIFPRTTKIVYGARTVTEPLAEESVTLELPGTKILNWLFDPAYDLYVLDDPGLASEPREGDLAATTATRWTHHEGYAGEPTVAWDGNLVLYVTYNVEGGALHLLDRHGQHLNSLLKWPGYLGGARLSPDGQTIVFHATPRDGRPGLALYLCHHDGSNVRVLTARGTHNFSPAWHPSQEFIIYSSDGDDQDFELNTIRPDGTRCQRVTFSPGLDAFPAFSRTGQQILWTSQRLAGEPWQTNIWRAIWIP